jgi:aquaporin Z
MRKYIAEFLGTLVLVAMGTGVAVFASTQYGPFPIAIAFGIAVIGGAYAFGPISGAHFNPAVSLAAAINGRISWLEFLGYVVAQILGAFAGTGVILGVVMSYGIKLSQFTQAQITLGATDFQISMIAAILIEAFLTFIFVLVILLVTSKKSGTSAAPMAIGLTLTGLIMLGLSATGASLNPARSLAPAVVMVFTGSTTALTNYVAYLVGPMVGAALAAVVARFGLGSEEDAEVK